MGCHDPTTSRSKVELFADALAQCPAHGCSNWTFLGALCKFVCRCARQSSRQAIFFRSSVMPRTSHLARPICDCVSKYSAGKYSRRTSSRSCANAFRMSGESLRRFCLQSLPREPAKDSNQASMIRLEIALLVTREVDSPRTLSQNGHGYYMYIYIYTYYI